MNYVDMADLCPYLGLFFAIQVFKPLRAEEAPLGCLDEPLVAVRVVGAFADGVIGDDVVDEVFGAVVSYLMCFAGREDKGIAWLNGGGAVIIANKTRSGDDVVEFPLGTMNMEGVVALPRRNGVDLDVERVPVLELGGFGIVAQSFG